ncbi:hypothetical protein IU405_11780 [Polaribacter sp. BAL334]|uniref:hypothetical protein n=1 Tax=Polaribacter sp. BAL334 TaxID=1708178 RepID=UPI0018D2242D|nr:hypothetical protein [Polaribacter sp. BAL334]MBG7612927.1 hypothetical protein [Polaribacter sp. BAL334]
MLNYLSILRFSAIILLNSTNNSTKIASQKTTNIETIGEISFWNSLKALQGKTFEGTIENAPANDDFFDKKLVMHVLYSDDETILIPFNVGDNLSRTWIFTNKNNRIQLKHDHRMKNGENDKITMYGGIASNQGTSTMQIFPADEETQKLIPAAFSNVWWVTLDNNTFTYNLRRIGSDRVFTVSFDLTKEIEKPAPSWGWENFKK